MTFIKSHEHDRLLKAYERLPKPMFIDNSTLSTIGETLATAVDVASGGLLGAILRAVTKVFAQGWFIKLAALAWLNPRRSYRSTDAVRLKKGLGLGELSDTDFVEKIISRCRQLSDLEPELIRHVNVRISILEFLLQGPSTIVDSTELNLAAHTRLIANTALAAGRGEKFKESVGSHLKRVVLAAASILAGSGEKGLAATIMIPVKTGKNLNDIPTILKKFINAQSGIQKAQDLWDGLTESVMRRAFVVVTEEPKDLGHNGFWVPDVRPNGIPLVGAAKAFVEKKPNVVFRDDHPPLPVANKHVADKWEQYMSGTDADTFSGCMFLSFPIVVEDLDDPGSMDVVGIINIDVLSDQPWIRAYSDEWLGQAFKQMKPWIEMAWIGLGIDIRVGNGVPSLSGLDPQSIEIGGNLSGKLLIEGPKFELLLPGGEENGEPEDN